MQVQARNRQPRGPGGRGRRYAGLCAYLFLCAIPAARADTFAAAAFDPDTDELVVTMLYRGTNPDHAYSLKWGRCRASGDGSARQVSVEVLDSQWQDVEQSDFRKTVRFSLAGLHCRPATVTLRSAPRFFYTLTIPAARHRQP